MAINVFEGSRRVARIAGALWVIACVWVNGFGDTVPSLQYSVEQYGGTPTLDSTAYCGLYNRAESVPFANVPEIGRTGRRPTVELCFKARKSSGGDMLIPYTLTDDGKRVLMNDSYSDGVREYTREIASNFRVDAAGMAMAKEKMVERQRQNWINAVQYSVGGLVFGWVFIAAIGYVARGFMGIPAGRDAKREDTVVPQ